MATYLESLRKQLTAVAADLDGMTREMAGSWWHTHRVNMARNLVSEIERLVDDVRTGPVVKAQRCSTCGHTTISLAPICGRCRNFFDRHPDPGAKPKSSRTKPSRRRPVAITA